MERQTKHRILGVLVIVGLVIILLPFFQGGESSESALVQAPPFPDQSTQVSINTSTQLASANDSAAADASSSQQTTTEPAASPDPLLGSVNDGIKPLDDQKPLASSDETKVTNDRPDEAIDLNQKPSTTADTTEPSMIAPNVVSNESSDVKTLTDDESTISKSTDDSSQASESQDSKENQKVKTKLKKRKELAKKPSSHPKSATHETQKLSQKPALKAGQIVSYASLIDAKGSAVSHDADKPSYTISSKTFAVQVGTFKNKANALRLVNKLRTKGYKSFIQEAQLPSGSSSTRVLVGPEKNQAVARSLANKLKNEFDVQGVVIGYKPLAI